MAKYNRNNVEYQDIAVAGKSLGQISIGSVISHSPYMANGEIINDRYDGEIDEPIPFINVIDIDWDDVKYGETTISTTDDLIINLENTRNEISTIKNNISQLNNSINDINSTEISIKFDVINNAINCLDQKLDNIINEFNYFKEK